MPTEPDYYDLLQVPFDAGSKEIITTYRRLARQYHPDIATDPAATKRMLALNRAIEILGDPKRRREYDARRLQARAREALARKSAESESPATAREDGAERQGTEPRLTRAIATRNTEVGWPTRAIARRPESKGRPIALIFVLCATMLGVLTATAIAIPVYLGNSSKEAVLVQPTIATGASPSAPPSSAAGSTAPSPTESPFPYGGDVFESRGIWLVGPDMTPGIWRAVRAGPCAWKRLSARDPTDEAVVGSGSSLTVELHPSDVAFWSEGCGWWTQVMTPPSASPTDPFGPGTWLVGAEISPGLWHNSDSSQRCSWARLASLDGGPSSTTASDVTSASAVTIEISAGDVAFHSWGCGTWTRTSG
jgi:hypothetical protein